VERLKEVVLKVLREASLQGPDVPKDGKDVTTEL